MSPLPEIVQFVGENNSTDPEPSSDGASGLLVLCWLVGITVLFGGLHYCQGYLRRNYWNDRLPYAGHSYPRRLGYSLLGDQFTGRGVDVMDTIVEVDEAHQPSPPATEIQLLQPGQTLRIS
ncbi:MAG: hypothetical protein P1U63_10395 [Coxiellaceae bacterium]|nr:hypothetical protein [Coxiellaceae bacterium]